ncbi:MAG: ABC transporter permease [Caldilinea sp. CFX5]|nr:ABC transporter permease [Caldilinea sp. CFX5]
MGRFILRRLLLQLFVLWGLSLFTFLLMFQLPGDPAAALAVNSGAALSKKTIEEFRARWGFDKPFHEQYLAYMGNVLRGDLGLSLATNRKIADELRVFFPATVELSLAAAVLALLFGVPAGILSAVRRNSWIDHATRLVSLLGVSMPIFWLAILCLYLFYYQLQWLPSSQRIPLTMSAPPFVTGLYLVDALLVGNLALFRAALHHLILPAAMLAFSAVGWIARITRASMLEVLGADYIRTARAKGLARWAVLIRHALKNAMIPTITALGLLIGSLLSGAVLTETIFAWPGIGRFAVQSIFFLDRPVVMAVTLLIGVVYSFVNLGVDILVAYLDPRVSYA